MMELWAIWSSRVDPYAGWDLVQVFLDEDVARRVKAELIGKQAAQRGGAYLWYEDPDGDELFNDLHVRPLVVA